MFGLRLFLTKGEGGLSTNLNSYHFVCRNDVGDSVLWISELGIFVLEVSLSHPTGDRAAPSDINGNLVLYGGRQKLF